ncbi:MAG: carboxypeptidase regulatory-like domain-containing protein, partial [Candidatus Eremiobacteraeota bacterium]|nr:carboxypeptidase regulatory-like domain-containing protein [Candidatus Eremiobacteraeota bacterium]
MLVASIGLLPFPVAAATVGQLAGQLTDAKTHAPLGNVKVTAVSPSGRATATTDARGFYSILGLVPDTYALSFERSGYQTGLLQGITVTADTTTTADQTLAPSLQQIGHVSTRSVSSAYQPDQPHDTYTVSSKDITEEQGTALNINATQLFSSLPSVTNAGQNMGVPVIRAGRANEIGVSVNGIPVTNAYSGTYGAAQLQDMSYSFDVLDSIPTLAVRDVQLTPGVADASYGATGTGNFNIVFKKGTYPSFSDVILGIGGGHYYHGFSVDHGWATPDGRWATYFMFHGDNTYPHWGPQNTAQEVGVQGYPGLTVSRQFVGNVNYNWGQDNKFGLEFQAYSDYGALAADYGLNNNTLCFSSCNQSVATGGGDCGVTGLDNTNLDPHNGPVATINPVNKNTILMPNCWALLPYYPGQTDHAQSLGSAGIPAYSEDFPHYNYSLAFHENLNPSTYFNARYFRAGGYETDDRANGGATAYIWQKGGTTTGLTMDLTSQLGSKNLLKVGGQFSYENPQVNQSLPGWGLEIVEYGALTELYDFTPQNYGFNGCAYTGALAAAMLPNNQNYCGYLENVTGAGLVQIPGKSLITNIHPHFWSGYITDQWKPNSHLIVNAGGRLDAARYDYPAVGLDPATCTSLYTPLTVTPPT